MARSSRVAQQRVVGRRVAVRQHPDRNLRSIAEERVAERAIAAGRSTVDDVAARRVDVDDVGCDRSTDGRRGPAARRARRRRDGIGSAQLKVQAQASSVRRSVAVGHDALGLACLDWSRSSAHAERRSLSPIAALARRNRPGDRRRHPPRGATAGRGPRAHRLGELRQPRHPRGRRLGADQQVRRGLPGQALLRRLRVRRRRRVAGHRARQGAVRRRPRQRAAALGRAGEHGGLPAAAQAGRHGARHEPRPRRPPHARPPAQLLGQALHDRPLRRPPGRRADRLRRARAAGARAQAEDDHRRRQRLSARHRLRAHRARGARRSARR